MGYSACAKAGGVARGVRLLLRLRRAGAIKPAAGESKISASPTE